MTTHKYFITEKKIKVEFPKDESINHIEQEPILDEEGNLLPDKFDELVEKAVLLEQGEFDPKKGLETKNKNYLEESVWLLVITNKGAWYHFELVPGDTPPPEETGTITGRVLDSEEKPMEDAYIQVPLGDKKPIYTKSQKDGGFKLEGVPFDKKVVVNASHKDYYSASHMDEGGDDGLGGTNPILLTKDNKKRDNVKIVFKKEITPPEERVKVKIQGSKEIKHNPKNKEPLTVKFDVTIPGKKFYKLYEFIFTCDQNGKIEKHDIWGGNISPTDLLDKTGEVKFSSIKVPEGLDKNKKYFISLWAVDNNKCNNFSSQQNFTRDELLDYHKNNKIDLDYDEYEIVFDKEKKPKKTSPKKGPPRLEVTKPDYTKSPKPIEISRPGVRKIPFKVVNKSKSPQKYYLFTQVYEQDSEGKFKMLSKRYKFIPFLKEAKWNTSILVDGKKAKKENDFNIIELFGAGAIKATKDVKVQVNLPRGLDPNKKYYINLIAFEKGVQFNINQPFKAIRDYENLGVDFYELKSESVEKRVGVLKYKIKTVPSYENLLKWLNKEHQGRDLIDIIKDDKAYSLIKKNGKEYYEMSKDDIETIKSIRRDLGLKE